MIVYYILFVISYILSMCGTYLNKKYQLTAGTKRMAFIIYMLFNGIIPTLFTMFMLILSDERLEFTPYSLIMAFAIVMSAAIANMGTFKAYEKGQIATVTIISTIGSVIISCAWGVLFLKENVSAVQAVAIILMLVSVISIMEQKDARFDKSLLGLLMLVVAATGTVNIVSKQHQIEQAYATVNTLSFSLWVGVVRIIVFTVLLLSCVINNKESIQKISQKSVGYASGASLFGGVSYILTLVTATVIPITIGSPLGTALGIFLTSMMAWVAYHEKMTKRQIFGMVLCIISIFMFAWS